MEKDQGNQRDKDLAKAGDAGGSDVGSTVASDPGAFGQDWEPPIGPKLSEVESAVRAVTAGKPAFVVETLPYDGLGHYWGGFFRHLKPWAERDLWNQFQRRAAAEHAAAVRARQIEEAKAVAVQS